VIVLRASGMCLIAIGKSKRVGAEQWRLLQIFDTYTGQKVAEITDVGGLLHTVGKTSF
jgi:hypothetical protein